ncbi:MAG: aspartate kinase [Bacteroidetes bacterium]|nr:aspartate kinase [Bacteroidota bacterium]MBS1974017.1 aspartate kinase [Bacteroidota bacterium]
MKVFKFGGASASTVERIKHLPGIIKQYHGDKILVVISAMGKTTNALEKVAEAFYDGRREDALHLFNIVKQNHLTTAKYILVKNYNATEKKLADLFTEAEWLLHDKPVKEYDYYYDQVVCIGELLSTTIISAYLHEEGINNEWLDVRDIFRTDDNFRDANIDWAYTENKVKEIVLPVFQSSDIIITQGFIGSTNENESTTLGREGSDYSAAVFANMLNAESQAIWKDVEGVMNADPKQFPDAEFISELSYNEVIEMAYYGAQVIHPKTIKPLQNKNIPLYVKCFLDPSFPGTVIHKKSTKNLPPIIVLKPDQALLHLHAKDFSFVGEKHTAELYHLFAEIKIKPNLIQSGAVNLQVCIDDRTEKVDKLAAAASGIFDVQAEKGLTLLTIRHYNNNILDKLTAGKEIVLKQQSQETVQALMR